MRSIAERFKWTASEHVVRVNALLQHDDDQQLGERVTSSVRWMREILSVDRMEKIRHMMLGTQRGKYAGNILRVARKDEAKCCNSMASKAD